MHNTMKKQPSTVSKSLSALFSLPTIDLMDRLEVMLSQEGQPQYVSRDYLHAFSSQQQAHSSRSNARKVTSAARAKIVRWLYDIVDYFNLERSTISMAMRYVDRFVSSPSARAARRSITTYQLTCLACLFLAIKTMDVTHLDVDMLVKASRGCYDRQEILDMEREVLDALGWRVCDATSSCISNHLMGLLVKVLPIDAPVLDSLVDFTRFQIELSAADYRLSVLRRPSTVALAAVLNSMELLGFNSSQKAVYHRVIQSVGLSLSSTTVREACHDLNDICDRQSEDIASRMSALSIAQQSTDCDTEVTPLPLPRKKSAMRCEPSPTCVVMVSCSSSKNRHRRSRERVWERR